MTPDEIIQAIEKFRIAYNEVDQATLENLLSENVKWGHRNKFGGEGRRELIKSIDEFREIAPDRYFGEYGRSAVNGQIVFAEQNWHATPALSNPAFGWEKGVPVSMETCSLFVFEDGQIIEWTDCG